MKHIMTRADMARRRREALAATQALLGPTPSSYSIVLKLVAERKACIKRIAEIDAALGKWKEVHESENHQGGASQEG